MFGVAMGCGIWYASTVGYISVGLDGVVVVVSCHGFEHIKRGDNELEDSRAARRSVLPYRWCGGTGYRASVGTGELFQQSILGGGSVLIEWPSVVVRWTRLDWPDCLRIWLHLPVIQPVLQPVLVKSKSIRRAISRGSLGLSL